MAAEPSCLTSLVISELLREEWSIDGGRAVKKLVGGISNCYLIDTPKGQLVLKECPTWFNIEDVGREAEVTDYLRPRGVPVSQFHRTYNGKNLVMYEGRCITLQDYIEGQVYEPNRCPTSLLRESAALLGKIHAELTDYPSLPIGMSKAWWESLNIEECVDGYRQYAAEHSSAYPGEVRTRVLGELQLKAELLSQARPAYENLDFDKLTQMNTHGDYKVPNMVCSGSNIIAVIDFSGCIHPIVWEVIRSYAHVDPEAITGSLSIKALVGYCKSYLTALPGGLSKYDLNKMADYWYVQLLRANYHSEYLSTQGATQVEALKFASWSTKVCNWLHSNKAALTEELLKLS